MAHDGTGTGWDETAPANADNVSVGAQELRDLRKGLRIRIEYEHENLTTSSAGGEHLPGSAKVYYDDSADAAALLRPDGVTSLVSTADDGRLLIEDGTGTRGIGQLVYWAGDAWTDVQVAAENYEAGSIDTVAITADAIDGTLIADDVIDSEHYVDGSIDEAHLSAGLKRGEQIILRHVVADTTDGGASVTGAWRTRPLNEETVDEGADCTLAANQFTLPTGTYLIRAWSLMHKSGIHQCRLRNISDGATETGCVGTVARSTTSVNVANTSVIAGQFTIAAQKTFELQYNCSNSQASDGLGSAGSFGEEEVYAVVELIKVT